MDGQSLAVESSNAKPVPMGLVSSLRVRIVYQPVGDQTVKRSLSAKIPAQVITTQVADRYLPAVTGKPGMLRGRCAIGGTARRLTETLKMIFDAAGIDPAMRMTVIDGDSLTVVSNNMLTTAAADFITLAYISLALPVLSYCLRVGRCIKPVNGDSSTHSDM